MRNISILLIAVLFSFCSGKKQTQTKGEKQVKIPYVLDEANIYDTTSIKAALVKATKAQKEESRKAFLQGLDLLANKNNPDSSIRFFKESILYYPDEKNYLHLFKAYVNSNDTTNSNAINIMLSNMAETWKIEYYEIDFNEALIAAAKKDTSACMSSLGLAVMDGFVFKDRVVDEKLFKFMENHLPFQSFVASTFGSDEKLNKILFKAFVKYYPDVELPYALNYDSVAMFDYDHYIDYNFSVLIPGMNDGRFSRDVTNEYMYVGKFKLEGGYAFIYKSFMAIADTLNPVKTFVVTYDTTGKMIENEMIGCFCSPTSSKSFVINKDLSINITDYKSNWESDPLEKGYAGNKIVSKEEEGKALIIIDKNGVLKREEVAKTTSSVNAGG